MRNARTSGTRRTPPRASRATFLGPGRHQSHARRATRVERLVQTGSPSRLMWSIVQPAPPATGSTANLVSTSTPSPRARAATPKFAPRTDTSTVRRATLDQTIRDPQTQGQVRTARTTLESTDPRAQKRSPCARRATPHTRQKARRAPRARDATPPNRRVPTRPALPATSLTSPRWPPRNRVRRAIPPSAPARVTPAARAAMHRTRAREPPERARAATKASKLSPRRLCPRTTRVAIAMNHTRPPEREPPHHRRRSRVRSATRTCTRLTRR